MANKPYVPTPLVSRVPIGSATVNGQKVEVVLNPEWGRYFQALANAITAGSDPEAPGLALALSGMDDSGVELVPVKGEKGEQGPQGDPGPALYLLQEPEDNDVLWPVKNT